MQRQARGARLVGTCREQGPEALHPQVLQIRRLPIRTPLHRERHLDRAGQGTYVTRSIDHSVYIYESIVMYVVSIICSLINLL